MRARLVHGVAVVVLGATGVALGRIDTTPAASGDGVTQATQRRPAVATAPSDADRADRADRASRSTRQQRVVRLAPGSVGRVTRRTTRREVALTALPFESFRRRDPSRYVGTTFVASVGRPGLLMTRQDVHLVNGRVIRRTKAPSQLVMAARPHVVLVGTKVRPKPKPVVVPVVAKPKPVVPPPAPRPTPPPPVRRPSVDGLNWSALAQCESGNNPRAVSPGGTYRGLYQFSLSTWRGVGGRGDPIDASRSEQTYRAQLLYRRGGAGQWPHCGARLFS